MKQSNLTPSALFLMTFACGVLLSLAYPWQVTLYMNSEVTRGLGVLLLLLSLGLNVLAYRKFKKDLTPHAPFMTPRVLITKGIFSYTRNPVYLALIVSQCALGFVFDSIWIVIFSMLLWILLDRVIVRPEEKILHDTFAHEFTKYKKMTRRWL